MTTRYQRLAISLYIGVIVAIALYIINNQIIFRPNPRLFSPPPHTFPLWLTFLGYGIIISFLILLEYQLTNKSLPHLPLTEAVIHLVLRFALVSSLLFLGRSPFAVYMFYPVLLFTFFTFGHKTAYCFGIVSTLIVFMFVASLSPSNFIAGRDLNNIFVYLLGLLLVILMANSLLQEQETNQQLIEANKNLETSHAKLRDYATQVAQLAATDERNRLARDIHDSLGHHLMASRIQLEKAGLFLNRDIKETATALDHAQRTLVQAISEVRSSVNTLRTEVDQFDLDSELNDLINRMRHHDLTIEFNRSGDSKPYSTFVKMTLYRIIQEGLTNIHKHANASQATIILDFSPAQASLVLTDNGSGFNLMNGKQKPGYGLQGIQERVALVGGQYKIHSDLQKGTVLTITTPQNNEMKERHLDPI